MEREGDGYYSASPSMISLIEPKGPDLEPEPPPESTDAPVMQTVHLPDHNHVEGQLQEQNWDTDRDSACENDSLIGDDTWSLASYITDYRYEHGRRYHAYRDGAYWVCTHGI
jgi:hypothetical protein